MKPTKSKPKAAFCRRAARARPEASNKKGMLNQDTLTALLVGLIVTGGVPIAIVANPFFVAIMEMLAPWYRIPSRKTVRRYLFIKKIS
jgi:hypothetical protein